MKRYILSLLVFMTCAFTAAAVSAKENEKPVFGPKQYDVKERYGIENRYQETFSATEGVHLIKLQNGENMTARSKYKSQTI